MIASQQWPLTLVLRKVDVIATGGGTPAARAAKNVTSTIGKAEKTEGHIRSGVGKAMDAIREVVNSEKK